MAFLGGLGKAPTFLVPIINPPFADNSPHLFLAVDFQFLRLPVFFLNIGPVFFSVLLVPKKRQKKSKACLTAGRRNFISTWNQLLPSGLEIEN